MAEDKEPKTYPKFRLHRTISVYNSVTKKNHSKQVGANTIEELETAADTWKSEMRAMFAQERKAAVEKEQLERLPTIPFKMDLPTNGGVAVSLVGAGRSGKSTILRYLLRTVFKHHLTTMFTYSAHADIYKEFPKKVIVANEYLPEVIKDCYKINQACHNKFPFLLVTDDMHGAAVKLDTQMLRLLTLYRNSNCSAIICGQSASLLSTIGRGNCAYILCGQLNTSEEIWKVIKMYLNGYFPTHMKMSEKIAFYQEATKDHTWFMVDNILNTCSLTRLSAEQVEE
jgi:hypothetical protein